jgi:hypothetical protein
MLDEPRLSGAYTLLARSRCSVVSAGLASRPFRPSKPSRRSSKSTGGRCSPRGVLPPVGRAAFGSVRSWRLLAGKNCGAIQTREISAVRTANTARHMAVALERNGERETGLRAPHGAKCPGTLRVFEGGHPEPTKRAHRALDISVDKGVLVGIAMRQSLVNIPGVEGPESVPRWATRKDGGRSWPADRSKRGKDCRSYPGVRRR